MWTRLGCINLSQTDSLCFLRYTQFVQGQNLKDSQCIVFAHRRPSAADLTRTQPRKLFICLKCS